LSIAERSRGTTHQKPADQTTKSPNSSDCYVRSPEPWIAVNLAGAVVGEPEGAVPVEPDADSLPCGHLPSTAGLTRTDAAVIGWPPWDSSPVGRTVTQLPAVTSLSTPAVTSVTLVDEVKSTVALPFSSWVT